MNILPLDPIRAPHFRHISGKRLNIDFGKVGSQFIGQSADSISVTVQVHRNILKDDKGIVASNFATVSESHPIAGIRP